MMKISAIILLFLSFVSLALSISDQEYIEKELYDQLLTNINSMGSKIDVTRKKLAHSIPFMTYKYACSDDCDIVYASYHVLSKIYATLATREDFSCPENAQNIHIVLDSIEKLFRIEFKEEMVQVKEFSRRGLFLDGVTQIIKENYSSEKMNMYMAAWYIYYKQDYEYLRKKNNEPVDDFFQFLLDEKIDEDLVRRAAENYFLKKEVSELTFLKYCRLKYYEKLIEKNRERNRRDSNGPPIPEQFAILMKQYLNNRKHKCPNCKSTSPYSGYKLVKKPSLVSEPPNERVEKFSKYK